MPSAALFGESAVGLPEEVAFLSAVLFPHADRRNMSTAQRDNSWNAFLFIFSFLLIF
jgi:hypothetical protein